MKFILGLLTGIILGAVGAVAYSVQSGRDLRDAMEQIRVEIDDRDMDALGARLQAGLTQMQTQLDERLGQVRGKVSIAIDEVSDVANESAGEVAEAAHDGTEVVADAAKTGGDKAAKAASKAIKASKAVAE